MRKGFTLVELILVVGMLVAIIIVSAYVFRVVLTNWVSQDARAGIGLVADRAINAVNKDVREATALRQKNLHEIRFTLKDRQSDGTPIAGLFLHCIYYLYNSADGYPPNFKQSAYDLKRAVLNNVVGTDLTTGTFTYGSGALLADGILPPNASDLAVNGSTATVDLSIKKGSETMRTRTSAVARNVL